MPCTEPARDAVIALRLALQLGQMPLAPTASTKPVCSRCAASVRMYAFRCQFCGRLLPTTELGVVNLIVFALAVLLIPLLAMVCIW
jgi:hypothetical protein